MDDNMAFAIAAVLWLFIELALLIKNMILLQREDKP
jgi:hypothetical protein